MRYKTHPGKKHQTQGVVTMQQEGYWGREPTHRGVSQDYFFYLKDVKM